MRLLLVNSLYPPRGGGGAERSVAELTSSLIDDGHEVAVATLGPPANGPSLSVEHVQGVQVFRWATTSFAPFDGAPSTPLDKVVWHAREEYRSGARRFLERVVESFRPDLVHTNNIAGFGPSIIDVVKRYPWVHTLRDYYLICSRTTRYRAPVSCDGICWKCQLLTMRRRSAPVPNLLVGVSSHILGAHRRLGVWVAAPTATVANQPVVRAVRQREVSRISTVGYIGAVDRKKGVDLLLDAFAMVDDLDLRLIVAGEVSHELRDRARSLAPSSRVSFIGHVSINDFLTQVDLVLVPSRWEEPFGRVAAEAASVGLPVLVSDKGGLPETVRSVGNSRVVADDHPEAWAAAITTAAQQWSHYRVGGESGCRAEVSMTVGEQYLMLYQRVLGCEKRGTGQ